MICLIGMIDHSAGRTGGGVAQVEVEGQSEQLLARPHHGRFSRWRLPVSARRDDGCGTNASVRGTASVQSLLEVRRTRRDRGPRLLGRE